MLKFAIYVSNHGYGHATRMAALAEEFIHFGIYVHIRSARPDFIFQALDPNYSSKDDVICDVGVRHGKNLAPDVNATRYALLGLMSRRMDIVDTDVEFLRKEKIDLIIADIPWLAVEAGTYAGIPVFAISNFDWLFIYERLFADDQEIKPLLNTIYGLFQRVDLALRLPFSSVKSMSAFRKVEKVGLLATDKKKYQDIRKEYKLDPQVPLMVCTFGGEGDMDVDLEKICSAFPGYVFSKQELANASNHVHIDNNHDFISLIQASDILFTKPGYSSFAEATQYGKHIIYLPRDNYPEEEILIKGLKSYPKQTKLDSLGLSKRMWKNLFVNILSGETKSKHLSNCNSSIASLIIQRFVELKFPGSNLLSVFDVGSNNVNYALCETGNPIPIHAAQIYTGIGKNYHLSQDGQLSIPASDIGSFKKRVSDFLIYDKGIKSYKQVLATGIHRKAENADVISKWFQERWGLAYNVLSEKEERELAFLAAKNLIPKGNSALIVDLGGFTADIVFYGVLRERKEYTLPLGLLILNKMAITGTDINDLIHQHLDLLDEFHPDVIICVGLSATFLAKIITKAHAFTPDSLNGIRISRQSISKLNEQLAENADDILNNAMEPQSKDILRLSVIFYTLLLDRFSRSEFIVSYYGISAGYNLWKKCRR